MLLDPSELNGTGSVLENMLAGRKAGTLNTDGGAAVQGIVYRTIFSSLKVFAPSQRQGDHRRVPYDG